MSPHSTAPRPKARGPKAQRVGADQLLDAAERVFSAHGLVGASLRAIAAEAGCDASLIYYHFDSKEAMFLALLDRTMPPLHQDLRALASATDQPVVLRLWEVLRLYHRHLGHHQGLRAIVRGELVRGAEGLQQPIGGRLLRNVEQIWSILQQGLASGELRPDLEPKLAAFFLVKTFMETQDLVPRLCAVLQEPVDLTLPQAARAWYQLYWRGVAANPLTPLPDLPEL